ncbi:MAG TPA: response regulator [Verrucomicrobiae bacterium]|nr:response regulator [Verrucomicrobiae bacterium]
MQASDKRILIIENDSDMLFMLDRALNDAGYTVEACKVGSGIVEHKHTWPDLFILDKELPTIDGIAVCKFLRYMKQQDIFQ